MPSEGALLMNVRLGSLATFLASTAALLFVSGCDGTGPAASEESARVRILLTDAPTELLEEAIVEISRVYLIRGEEDPEEAPPFVDLFHDEENPLVYDLLELRDGVVADMTGAVEIPAGRYNQLRMIVKAATVTLAGDYRFADGAQTRSLFIPGAARTGIKVNLARAVEAEARSLTTLLVDFDVDRNFVIQGNPNTPAGIQGILFTPVLKELSRTRGGSGD